MTDTPRFDYFAVIDGELIPTTKAVLERYRRAYGDNLPIRFIPADDIREVPHD